MTKQKHFGYVQLQKIREIAVAKLRAKQKQELNAMAIKWHKEEQDMTKAILDMGKTPYFKWAEWLKTAVHEWERKQVEIAKAFGMKDYEDRSHSHCFDNNNPPCGIKGIHRCCLCGKPVPKSTGRRISK